jgi:hypothetical protein
VRDEAVSTEPPFDTINPVLLDKRTVDWDGMVHDNWLPIYARDLAVFDAGQSITDERSGLLLPSPSLVQFLEPSGFVSLVLDTAMTDVVVYGLPGSLVNDTGELREGNSAIDTPLVENVSSLSDPCVYIQTQESRNFIGGFPTPPSDSHSPPVMRH